MPSPGSFLLIFLVPLAILTGWALGGWWNFLLPVIIFGVIPILDLLLGVNELNPTAAQTKAHSDDLAFKAITWITVPIQLALVVWGAYTITTQSLTLVELTGLTLSIGISGGVIGTNVAHELVHRFNRFERFLGLTLLWTVSYMHWAIEHVQGHHVRVATPDDPAVMKRKVVRGGSWKDIARYLQVSTRDHEYQDSTKSYIGFRCVRSYLGDQ